MTITQERIAELRGLLQAATPTPWQAQAPDEIDVFVPIIGVRLNEHGEPMETPTNGLVGGATLFPTEIDAEDYTRAIANAALMVGAVNAAPALLDAAEQSLRLEEAMDWFGSQRTLELYFYQPVYGDDDDQAREWRVDQVGGSINDHERTTVGRGSTPIEAIASARATLRREQRHD